MTSANLAADLRGYEGLRLTAYPDPLSGAAPWTIGYGHTGREVHPGLIWTQAQAEDALASDIAAVCRGLDSSLPWWRSLDDVRQDCLADMAFNIGLGGLLQFAAFLALVKARDFTTAAEDLLHTHWAAQVGARANRIAEQMRGGLHQIPA